MGGVAFLDVFDVLTDKKASRAVILIIPNIIEISILRKICGSNDKKSIKNVINDIIVRR